MKNGNKGEYSFYYKVEGIFNKDDEKKDVEDSEFIAFCGIGNPESFKNTLLKNKISFSKFFVFPDHYEYKKKDIEKLLSYGKNLITTEKDFVKLKKYGIKELYYLKIDTILSEKFKEEFLKEIEKRIQL